MYKLNRLLMVIILLLSIDSNAQLTINYDNLTGPIVNGIEVVIDTNIASNIALPHFYITNNTGSAQDWIITRKIISQPNDWLNYLCWGDLCYGASPLVLWSSNATTILDGNQKELNVYIGALSDGSAHYRYYVSTDGINYLDSVDVVFNATTFIGVQESQNIELILYPIPVVNVVKIAGFNNVFYNLSVYEYTGRLVFFREDLNTDEIDVTSLYSGSYVFVFKNNQTQEVYRQKVIIEK